MAVGNKAVGGFLILAVAGAIVTLSVNTFAAKTATFSVDDGSLDKQSICFTRDNDGNKTVIVSFDMTDAVTGLRYTAGWTKKPADVAAWNGAQRATLSALLLAALQEARTDTNLQP